MKDLKISYDNESGKRINVEYDTIMDFTDVMESDEVDIPMMDYENVEADFFENPLNHKHFDTIEDLYNHCKMIGENMNKVKVIITTLDEFGEEIEEIIKECDTKEEAECFVLEHEQDFADNSEIYSVYIEE